MQNESDAYVNAPLNKICFGSLDLFLRLKFELRSVSQQLLTPGSPERTEVTIISLFGQIHVKNLINKNNNCYIGYFYVIFPG